MSWTTIQLGSREHYAVPISLREAGCLDCCITDAWLGVTPAALARPFSPSLAGRRSERLSDEKVCSNTVGRLLTDVRLKLQGRPPWPSILERNAWFSAWAAKQSAAVRSRVVFSYAYTAREAFSDAKQRGARCILGQIDPGPCHYEIVSVATAKYGAMASAEAHPPPEYWRLWREEIAQADRIVVNSPWSAKLLVEAGVPPTKMVEIPLVYAPAARSNEWRVSGDESGPAGAASPPQAERAERRPSNRLQALFLGSVTLAKGVGKLFDAIQILKNDPVDFTFAGPISVRIPDEISQCPNVRFLGPVDKAAAEKLYRESDVFLFPTLSDGFGLTQLEALGHGLPVIASTHCGQVVEDRVSGLVLSEVSPEAIADAIMQLVRDRDLLSKLKANARVPEKCHPRHLAPALLALEKA